MARLGRWLPLAIVVALLGTAMLATIWGNPTFEAAPGGVGTEDQRPPPEVENQVSDAPEVRATGEPGAIRQLPSWVSALLLSLCAAAVLVLVGALLWSTVGQRLLERRVVFDPADADEVRRRAREEVRAAVDSGLADLDIADSDPRRAVIACWVRLEAAATAAGVERAPGDTSTELVERVLAVHQVTPSVLAGLAAVYREARFAPHVVDEAMRDAARSALRQLRDELAESVSAEAGADVSGEVAAP